MTTSNSSLPIQNFFYDYIFLDVGFVVKELSMLRFISDGIIVSPFTYKEDGSIYMAVEDSEQLIINQYLNQKNSEFNAFMVRLKKFLQTNLKDKKGNAELIQSFVCKLNSAIGFLSFKDEHLITECFESNTDVLNRHRNEIDISLVPINRLFIELNKIQNLWIDQLVDGLADFYSGDIYKISDDEMNRFKSEEFKKTESTISKSLVLLHETGIIEALKTKYPKLQENNQVCGILISRLINKTNQTLTVIRTLNHMSDTRYHKTKRNPLSKKNINQTKEELLKLGIE